MTTLHLSGLTFRVSSPSLLELVHDWPGVSILLAFDSEKWQVHYRDFMHEVMRDFKSRDHAITLLADRRAA